MLLDILVHLENSLSEICGSNICLPLLSHLDLLLDVISDLLCKQTGKLCKDVFEMAGKVVKRFYRQNFLHLELSWHLSCAEVNECWCSLVAMHLDMQLLLHILHSRLSAYKWQTSLMQLTLKVSATYIIEDCCSMTPQGKSSKCTFFQLIDSILYTQKVLFENSCEVFEVIDSKSAEWAWELATYKRRVDVNYQ